MILAYIQPNISIKVTFFIIFMIVSHADYW